MILEKWRVSVFPSSYQAAVEKFGPLHSGNGRHQIKWNKSKSFFRFCEAKLSTDAEGADALRDLKPVEICWKR